MDNAAQRPPSAASEPHRMTDSRQPRSWPLLQILLRLQSQARAG